MVVALLLSFAIYLGWGYYALDKRKHAPPPPPAAETTSPVLPAPAAPGAVPTLVVPSGPGTNPPPVATPEQIIDLDSPELHLSLSSWGGALVHAELKAPKYQRRVEDKDEAVDLARITSEGHRQLETRFGGGLATVSPTAAYDAVRDADGNGIRFTPRRRSQHREAFLSRGSLSRGADLKISGAAPEHVDCRTRVPSRPARHQ